MRRPALAVLALVAVTLGVLTACSNEPAEEATASSAIPAAATSTPTTYVATPDDLYLTSLEGRGLSSDLSDAQMLQIGSAVCTFIPMMSRDTVVETVTGSTRGDRDAAEIIVDSAKQQLCRSSSYLVPPAAPAPEVVPPAPATVAPAPAVVPPAPAVAPAEPDTTVSQRNALGKARSYLDFSAFSRTGLIEQLEFEGFSTDDATFAVDTVTVDWMVQAEKKAQSYLDFSSFSRSGLIDQLEFEGFTSDQAEHGANSVGL